MQEQVSTASTAQAAEGVVQSGAVERSEREQLQAELAKWRERVPKLASALRERTEEADWLRRELGKATESKESNSTLPDAGSGGGITAGIKARDELIEELEVKLEELGVKHKDAEGQLHTRDFEVAQLKKDVDSWKQKWQSLTLSLDEQAALVGAKGDELDESQRELETSRQARDQAVDELANGNKELASLRSETESLKERNENLFETTELANRQLESLGENLQSLRDEVRAKDEALARSAETVAQAQAEVSEERDKLGGLEGEVASLQRSLENNSEELTELRGSRDALCASRDELQAERETLTAELSARDQALDQRAQEIADFERKLTELSDVCRTHESELAAARLEASSARDERQDEHDTLTAELSARDQALDQRAQEIADFERKLTELSDVCHTHESELAAARLEASSARGERQDEHDTLTAELSARDHALSRSAQEIAGFERKLTELSDVCRTLESDLSAARAEVTRLEGCVGQANESANQHEAERRHLSEELKEANVRSQHLQDQLSERSSLVVGLEREKTDIDSRTATLGQENARLKDALEKVERHASEHAEHITQLDSRLERQKELMANLERELSESEGERKTASKSLERVGHKDREIAELTATLTQTERQLQAHEAEIEALQQVATQAAVAEHVEVDAEAAKEQELALQATLEQVERLERQARQSEQERTEFRGARQVLQDKLDELERQLQKQTQLATEAESRVSQGENEDHHVQETVERNDAAGQIAGLQHEVLKLEGMLRERTEELNKQRWREEMASNTGGAGPDNKMLVVLNQQLTDAREENARLRSEIHQGKESSVTSVTSVDGPDAAPEDKSIDGLFVDSVDGLPVGDDLTRIRGVGDKLAAQLDDLGFNALAQIATLNPNELEDEDHPLFSLKSRIIRDEWIEQAAELIAGS